MNFGPREKADNVNQEEQLEIIEAYQEAQEYLETGFSEDDFYFEPEE